MDDLFMVLICGLIFVFVLVSSIKHYLSERDKEWAMWAMDKGIMDGFPKYGYTSEQFNLSE